ncbi:MAG: heme peroxidase family protein [Ktedonobacteraceae bacterium]
MSTHSCVISPHLKDALSPYGNDSSYSKYGRMFPHLHAPHALQAKKELLTPNASQAKHVSHETVINDTILRTLGRAGSVMDISDAAEEDRHSDNPRIAAGFTFFGQFIAHDITADRSLLAHHARLKELHNFRQPRLDLECVYGAGPTGEPFFYDLEDPDKLLIGINDKKEPEDVPRNQQGRALVADARNDVHLFISQLHLAVLKFHNRVIDEVRKQGVAADEVFRTAQRIVRWHYQWIVINEFLPLTVGEKTMNDILDHGPRYFTARPGQHIAIPVEFADAAYRFGHSQIRPLYILNEQGAKGQVFPDCAGTCPVNHDRVIDWTYFFVIPGRREPQASKRINTKIAHSLIDLPERVVGITTTPEEKSLAYRDLERGSALSLPVGEAIARFMGVEPLSKEEIGLRELGWDGDTPLWYYLLKEAEVRNNGEFMGDVGGRIIAEVLLGLITADPNSYWHAEDDWKPTLPAAQEGQFTMADLLHFAGAV